MDRTYRWDGEPIERGILSPRELMRRLLPALDKEPNLLRVWIFGSQVKRRFVKYDSDIDLIVEDETGENCEKMVLPFDRERRLEKTTGKIVSIIRKESYDMSPIRYDSDIEDTKVLIFDKTDEGGNNRGALEKGYYQAVGYPISS